MCVFVIITDDSGKCYIFSETSGAYFKFSTAQVDQKTKLDY